MEKLENRNNIRLNNQLSIITALRKEKQTITDLADYLEISFSATRHIVDELVEGGICKYSSKQAVNARGRTPVFVELNPKAGVVCAIDFSSSNLRVALCSIDGKPLVATTISSTTFITKEHLKQAEEAIRDLLTKPEVKGRPLLSICISSPGLIDPRTFEYVSAYRVKDYENMNPVSYFSNIFHVDVEMHNDVRLGCLAELKYGNFPNKAFNGMFLHIGTSSGFSFVNEGKIYEGAKGFAGEACTLNLDNPFGKEHFMDGRLYSLWEVVNDMNKKRGLEPLKELNDIDLDKIVRDYENNDPITVEAIDTCCKYDALIIISLSSLLDLDYVIVEGPILKFGDSILTKISKYISELSVSRLRTRILSSALGSDSSLIGAEYQAQTIHFLRTLEVLNRKRLRVDEFRINPAFKDI